MPPWSHARRRHCLAGREAAARRPRGPGADPFRPAGAPARHGGPHRSRRPGRHPARQAPPHPDRGRSDPALASADGRFVEGVRDRPALERRSGTPDPGHPRHDGPHGGRVPAARTGAAPHHRRGPSGRSPRPRPPGSGLGPGHGPGEPPSRSRPPLGEALLDQRNLAGIGNVYKSELCFLLGVTPWLPVGALPTDLAVQLPVLAKKLLEFNRDRPARVTTGRREQNLFVYGRASRPCLRCGTRIRSANQGDGSRERPTYWCPRCQTGPAPPPGGHHTTPEYRPTGYESPTPDQRHR